MERPVRIALFGTVDADSGGGLVPVAGAKLQLIVAMLALAAPHPVPDGQLIEALWGDAPGTNPANTLQAQIVVLRRLLGRDAVLRRSSGYVLDVEVDDIDVHRLERLVGAGRDAAAGGDHDRATTELRRALALVRGPALAGLLDHDVARAAAARIDELVLSAHAGLIDAELAAGRHDDVLPTLVALVEEHPLWERFHAQLMIALYRSGRQSDALRAYRNARTVLVEEMGIEPGPELQALERAVLTQDAALSAPAHLRVAAPARRPAARTSFVGRVGDLAELDAVTSQRRLVTVVGTGGVGKTRLVLEHLAQRPLHHETWFVELAAIVDPLAVPEEIASTLGAHDIGPVDTTSRPPDVRAADRIGGREVVLVLDNCEHVIDVAARTVSLLLDACPRLRIIATSRQPLDVAGEHQLPLDPLDDVAAAQLFTERAVAVRPTFDAEPDDVTQLCRQLDRLPLAIELAAARVKTMPVSELTARLDDRFGLLHGGRRDVAERHRGLGAAIDWSWDALFEDERQVFCRLAVFAGGATIEAASAVCGPSALEVITRLVDKSLVVADTSATTARFGMLESLREYGLERLAAADALDDAVARHRQWCIDLAEAAELGVRSGDAQLDWIARLDTEHDNLRAALSRPDRDGACLRLIAALLLPWWLHERGQEARHWADSHLASSPDAPRAVVAKAEAWCGLFASSTGWLDRTGGIEHELTTAAERQRRSLEYAEGVGDDLAAAYCRLLLAFNILRRRAAGMGAEVADVADHMARMTATFRDHDDDFGLALAYVTAALHDIAAGDLTAAAAASAVARRHAERSGERFSRARVALIDGMLASTVADDDVAYRHIEQCMQLHEELGMNQEVTSQALLLAGLADSRGLPALGAQWRNFVAERHGGASRDDMLITAAARSAFGRHARRAGHLQTARTAHLDAVQRFTAAGAASGIAAAEVELGYVTAAIGDPVTAAEHHDRGLRAAIESGEPAALAIALEGVAAAVVGEHPDSAAVLLGAAATQWEQTTGGRPPIEREDVAATSLAATNRVGAAAFASSFEQGTGTSGTAALALARRLRGLPA